MDALALVALAGGAFLIAYFTYGRWVARHVFKLREDTPTPAVLLEDNKDFCPTRRSVVFGHHFTSIAGTGPIVGPAIAVMWGWLPATLWVIVGAIFIGAVHDLGSLVVSLRNKGRTIGDVAGDLLGPRVRLIFLAVLVMGLWIVLAIFGLVIAAVLRQYPAAIFPVIFQIPLALGIGLFLHKRGRSIVLPSLVALALMYLSVVLGDADFGPTFANLHAFNHFLGAQPTWIWVVCLLAYAYTASVLPVWTLLQPRDYINSLQLLSALGLLLAGLVAAATMGGVAQTFDNEPIPYEPEAQARESAPHEPEAQARESGAPVPSDPSDDSPPQQSLARASGSYAGAATERIPLRLVAPVVDFDPPGAPPLVPILFITIACGAISGFHCLVASGTTSKQLRRETDARPIGYGAMLTEGFLATLVIASCAAGIGLGVTSDFVFPSRTPTADTTPIRLLGGAPEYSSFIRLQDGRSALLARQAEGTWSLWNAHGVGLISAGSVGATVRIEDDLLLVSSTEPTFVLSGKAAFNTQYSSWSAAGSLGAMVGAFVDGAANLIRALGVPAGVAVALMGVFVASFAGTTMDTACRLQRYVIQELARTFLPRAPKRACPTCGYDVSGLSVAGKELEVPAPHTNEPHTNAPHTNDPSHPHTPAPHQDAEAEPGPAGEASGSAPAALQCPECGTLCPLDQTEAATWRATIRAQRALASNLNPFKWLATTHGATLFAVATAAMLAAVPPPGQALTWQNAGTGGLILWPLFGATNQLLAGLAFIVIAAWLIAKKRPWWFIALPTIIMIVLPAWALSWQAFVGNEANPSWLADAKWPLVAIAAIVLALEAWLVIEVAARMRRKARPEPETA